MDKELSELKLADAAVLTKNHRIKNQLKRSPSYFIPMSVFKKITGVPGVAGVNIYPATDGNTQYLLLAPATLGDTSDAEAEDITSYSYKINDGTVKTAEPVIYVADGPHPPPDPPKTKPNKLNSD